VRKLNAEHFTTDGKAQVVIFDGEMARKIPDLNGRHIPESVLAGVRVSICNGEIVYNSKVTLDSMQLATISDQSEFNVSVRFIKKSSKAYESNTEFSMSGCSETIGGVETWSADLVKTVIEFERDKRNKEAEASNGR
jgi:hypothetical protein